MNNYDAAPKIEWDSESLLLWRNLCVNLALFLLIVCGLGLFIAPLCFLLIYNYAPSIYNMLANTSTIVYMFVRALFVLIGVWRYPDEFYSKWTLLAHSRRWFRGWACYLFFIEPLIVYSVPWLPRALPQLSHMIVFWALLVFIIVSHASTHVAISFIKVVPPPQQIAKEKQPLISADAV
jgi:hypothetical protein